jgi:STE24 endopeptidase
MPTQPSPITPSLVLSLLFALALAVSLLLRFWLASRQIRHVARHRNAVPAAFAGHVSLAAHQKAADYTITKARFGLLELALGSAVLLGWTLLGGLDWLNGLLIDRMGGGMLQQLALVGAFALISGLIDLRRCTIPPRYGVKHHVVLRRACDYGTSSGFYQAPSSGAWKTGQTLLCRKWVR